jgi:hypothetical protein
MRAFLEIRELSQLRVERQLLDIDRPRALLGDDHFRDIGHVSQAILPAGMPLQERPIPLFSLLSRLFPA